MKRWLKNQVLPLAAALLLCSSQTWGDSLDGQAKFIQPAPELVTEGIPQIPSSLAPFIDRYTGLYGLPLAGWDPEKRQLWLKGLSSVTWVTQIESAGQEPVLRTYLQVPGVYDIYYQPGSHNFVYNRDTDGSEDFQFYYYDHQTRASTLLTRGKARNTEPVWSNAGDRIVYSSAQPKQEGVSLFVMSPKEPGQSRLLVASTGSYLKASGWSPDDRKVVYCDFAAVYASTLWLVDVETGERTSLTTTAAGTREYYDNPQFARDGRGVYVITDHESDTHRLAYIDLTTRRFKYLSSHIRWDVTEFEVAPDGKTLAFVTNEGGVSRLRLLDTATGTERPAPKVPAGVISSVKWHRNSQDLAFNLKSPRTPNDVFALHVPTGEAVRWAASVTNNLDTSKLVEPEPINWKSFDGRTISGFIYRPPSGAFKGRRPVIIDIHGGPEEQYSPVYGYEDNYYLNELGVVKIYPNVRGSTGYGRTFRQLDDGSHREDALKDIGALLDWVKAQPDLDPDRVLLQGASYGGYLVLSAAARYNERIRAVLSDCGPTNLVSYIESTEGWRRQLQRTEYGDERDPEMRRFLERVAPLNQAEKLKKPLMVIQGQNDPRVKTSEAEQLVQAVRKNGTPVWYLLARNEGHGFVQQNNRNYRLYSVAFFVQTYLLN